MQKTEHLNLKNNLNGYTKNNNAILNSKFIIFKPNVFAVMHLTYTFTQ